MYLGSSLLDKLGQEGAPLAHPQLMYQHQPFEDDQSPPTLYNGLWKAVGEEADYAHRVP